MTSELLRAGEEGEHDDDDELTKPRPSSVHVYDNVYNLKFVTNNDHQVPNLHPTTQQAATLQANKYL